MHIVASFNNYRPIPLDISFMGSVELHVDSEKAAIVSVPAGKIYYRYVVDGVEQHDPDKTHELFKGISP